MCHVEGGLAAQATTLVAAGETDRAIDIIYDTIDELLLAGKFEKVDEELAAVPMTAPPDVLLSYATITLAAAPDLRQRAAFMERISALDIWEPNDLAGLG